MLVTKYLQYGMFHQYGPQSVALTYVLFVQTAYKTSPNSDKWF